MNGTIREVLKESIHLHLAGGDPVGIDGIVSHAKRLHPDVFEQYGEVLALKGASAMVKHLLREATEISQDQEDQLYLPGMDAPLAIAFEERGEYRYIATRKAKWPHLEKALVERELNIGARHRATGRLGAEARLSAPGDEARSRYHPGRGRSAATGG